MSAETYKPASPRGQTEAEVPGYAKTPWFFQNRSHLIIASVAFLVLWPWWRLPPDSISFVIGLTLIAAGVALRLWCVRQIGGSAHKRSAPKAAELVTWGPYGWIRNPIYIANMTLFGGFAVLSGFAWASPALVGLMWRQYSFTVRFEEGFLRKKFGDAFEGYCARTPRWISSPRWGTPPEGFVPYPLQKILKRERSLLLVQVVGGLLTVLILRLI